MPDIALIELKRRLREQAPAEDITIEALRAGLEGAASRTRIDPQIELRRIELGGIPAGSVRPQNAADRAATLYFHGGGFVAGSSKSHGPLAASIASETGMQAFVPDYRLAPEHVWPAAEDDAFAAYRGVLDLGISPSNLAVVGDSAGANLVVTTLLRAKAHGIDQPRVCALMSPWIDLDLQGGSIERRAHVDPTLRRDRLERYAAVYRGRHRGTEILRSDLSGLPPVLIQAGGDEILCDDSVRLADALSAAGVRARLEIWPGLFHVWQAYAPWLQEGRAAIAELGEFLRNEMKDVI